MDILSIIFIAFMGFVLGIFLFPLLLFLRARRDPSWDDSNMMNIYRVIAHIATHPSDFARMQYENGKKAFPYLGMDELSEVTDTRPPKGSTNG